MPDIFPCISLQPWGFCLWLNTNFNASVPEQLQRGPDVRLQLVLHAGQTQELHLPL